MDIPWVHMHMKTRLGPPSRHSPGASCGGPTESNQAKQAHSEPTKANIRVRHHESTSISSMKVAPTQQAKPSAVTRAVERRGFPRCRRIVRYEPRNKRMDYVCRLCGDSYPWSCI
jgi:hypothetical protein